MIHSINWNSGSEFTNRESDIKISATKHQNSTELEHIREAYDDDDDDDDDDDAVKPEYNINTQTPDVEHSSLTNQD